VWRFLKRGPPEASWRARWRAIPPIWAGLLFPPLFYFAFSMTSAINIGMRHILMVYPFLYVACAAMLARFGARRAARYAMVALGALQIAECASIAPDYLAFFNALSGGPAQGPRYLVDSNIDWDRTSRSWSNGSTRTARAKPTSCTSETPRWPIMAWSTWAYPTRSTAKPGRHRRLAGG